LPGLGYRAVLYDTVGSVHDLGRDVAGDDVEPGEAGSPLNSSSATESTISTGC